jgi:hypothetical protein
VEKLQKNTKNNGKENFNGTQKTQVYRVLPKRGTKLIKSFGGKI